MKRIIPLLLCLFLLACVRTPDQETVVNKADHSIKDTLAAPDAEAYRFEAPERWEETIEMKNLNIVIDADVVLPETDRYPLQTIKRHTFTAEDVLTLLNACFTGPFTLRENRYSMTELEEDIRFELRGNAVDWDDETGEVTWEPLTEDTERLAELREMITQCPAEDTFVPFEPDILSFRNEPYVIRTGDGTILYLSFRNSAIQILTARNGQVQDEHTVWIGGFIGEPWHKTLDHITISEAAATETGNAVLDRAGLSRQFGVGLTEKGRIARAIVEDPYYQVLSEGYILRISRNGGGYVPFPQGGGIYMEDQSSALFEMPTEESYAQKWSQDWIELYISESGIGYVGWFDPNEFVAEASENVQLMSFSEIQSHIRDDLRYSYAWTDEDSRGITELHVSKIILSCAIERIPNDPDEAALVPAWVIVYNDSRSEKVKGHDKIMLINAIDGSYLHVG